MSHVCYFYKVLWFGVNLYNCNRSNKKVRFQWYLSISDVKDTVKSTLDRIPIIGGWLAESFGIAMESNNYESDTVVRYLLFIWKF